MLTYEELEKNDLRDLLNANWMTHDALWFAGCVQQFGIEKTNDLNRQAVRGMARVEAKRLKKALGIKTVSNGKELQAFMIAGFAVIKGAFMKFEMEFPDENRMLWRIPRCFAHDGVRRLGVIEGYQCGIVERLYGWFEELQIEYSINTPPDGCHMHKTGRCEMEIVFRFP